MADREGLDRKQVLKTDSARRDIQTVSAITLAAMVAGFAPGMIINFVNQRESQFSHDAVVRPVDRDMLEPKLVDEGILAKSIFDTVYSNLDEQSGRIARGEIDAQKAVIREHYLDNETFERVQTFTNLMSQVSQKHNVPEDILLGMTIFESRADLYAVSKAGAKGLTQMMDEMAQIHGLSISAADTGDLSYSAKSDFVDGAVGELDWRFYPEKILDATAAQLADSYERWGDWSLAIWEWHAGAPEIYDNLQDYIFRHFGEQIEELRGQGYEKSLELQREYKLKIYKYKLNAFKLLADPQILAQYEGNSGSDYTQIYVKGVVASAEVFRQMQAESLN